MKKIEIISQTDDFSGVKEITIPGLTGVCYDLSVKNVADLKREKYADRPGIYQLLDENIDNIYIGQTDSLERRISTHNTDFEWVRAITFSSRVSDFNVAHAKYLEFHLTNILKNLNRINIISGSSRPNNIGESEEGTALKFCEDLKQIMLALGINIYQEIEEMVDKTSDKIFYCEEGDAKAEVVYTNDGLFIIKKGSMLKSKIAPSAERRDSAFINEREKEIQRGNIDASSYEVLNDIVLKGKRSSGASSFILGRESTGKKDLRNREGETFGKVIYGENKN